MTYGSYSRVIPRHLKPSVCLTPQDPVARDSIERNIEFNGERAKRSVKATCSDARMKMLQSNGQYDVIDLDPYGSPSTLLDSAVQVLFTLVI